MGHGNDDHQVVDDLKNDSITENMQQGSAERRIVRQGLQFGKAKRIGGDCGERSRKVVQEMPAKPVRLTIEVLTSFLNLLFGLG